MLARDEQRRSLVAAKMGGGGAAARKPEGKQLTGSAPQPRPYLRVEICLETNASYYIHI